MGETVVIGVPESDVSSNSVHDALIIGAGVSGLYQLYRLRELGLDVCAIDRNSDLGGTWLKNRYPGCRFDSESYTYGFSFSQDVLDNWSWSEHFAAQPETLRYLNYVADVLDLRPAIRFDCDVDALTFDETSRVWTTRLVGGSEIRSRFVVGALGPLSIPTLPKYPGMDRFRGRSFHTFDWPDGLDLQGKRVAVIGTGATGVQVISAIAAQVQQLTVYQRRPNWCAPLHNRAISDTEMDEIRADYDEIFATCASTPGGFIHGPSPRSYYDTPPNERREFWERLYASPGFGKWVGNFREILTREDANEDFSSFVADKIRSRVDDPDLAEKLIPKDHGFGVQRVALETGYYEAYNLSHVELVELEETPIVEIAERGIRTSDQERDFDVIVYATGFDAITGAYDRMDVTGVGGRTLRDAWAEEPGTYLGILVHHFPNLFMIAGAQGASSTVNFPRSIEVTVDWITGLLGRAHSDGITWIEPYADAQAQWAIEVRDHYARLLLRHAKSWFTGYNENIPGRTGIRHVMYNGGLPRYRTLLDKVAAAGYDTLALSRTDADLPEDLRPRERAHAESTEP